MVLGLRAFAVLAGDLGLAFSPLMGRLTATCNSSSRESNSLFWSMRKPVFMWYTYRFIYTVSCL